MVTVGGTSAATANFGEQRQNSVSGVVFVDLNGNLLQDTNEQGLGGVSIALLSNGQIVTTTTTLENGTYAFTALAPGDYTIQETDPPGFVSSSPNIADVNVGAAVPPPPISAISRSARFRARSTSILVKTVFPMRTSRASAM